MPQEIKSFTTSEEIKMTIKPLFKEREIQLILALRQLQFGSVEIDVRNGVIQDKIKQKEKLIDISRIDISRGLDKHF